MVLLISADWMPVSYYALTGQLESSIRYRYSAHEIVCQRVACSPKSRPVIATCQIQTCHSQVRNKPKLNK